MDKVTIFSESLIISSIINKNLTKKIISILNEKEKKGLGATKSNKGNAFQTGFINDEFILKCLNAKVAECLSLYSKNMKKDIRVSILNFWINKNYKNSYNAPHVHPGANFSGVYYVNVSKKEGKLLFLKDTASCFTSNDMFFKGVDFNEVYQVQPVNNSFVLFPANLNHMVEPHNDNKPRISVSFNVNVSHND